MPSPEYHRIEPFSELAHYTVDESAVRMLAYRFCEENSVVILGQAVPECDDPVMVGTPTPENQALLGLLERTLDRPIRAVRLNAYEVKKALDIGYGRIAVEDPFKLTLRPIKEVSFEPDNSVSDMINDMLGRAVTLGASDIHLECYEQDVDVRFRIDGLLHQMNTPINRANVIEVISRLKIIAGLDITERRRSQDGRVSATFESRQRERKVDFRLAVLPGPGGEDVVMRILDSQKPMITLEQLGFSEQALARFRQILANPEGLFLVTGPTGSGKTTTLYAGLREVNSDHTKVLTVEDPVEYVLPKVNQKQVNPSMGFADFTRAFLRQDPDVILIGEIRDSDTAATALRAAQTGHLVLGTLHTSDAVGSVARLETLGLGGALLADTMLGALSQRLMRRICPHCRCETRELEPLDREFFKKIGYQFPLFRGEGCDHCRHWGFKGRMGIYELFQVDAASADLIADDVPRYQIRKHARQSGMKTLFDEALRKVKEGTTTFSELRRCVPARLINEVMTS